MKFKINIQKIIILNATLLFFEEIAHLIGMFVYNGSILYITIIGHIIISLFSIERNSDKHSNKNKEVSE